MTQRVRDLLRPVRPVLLRLARSVLRRPRLRAGAMRVLYSVPRLHTLLRRAIRGADWRPPRRAHMPRNIDDLSPATLSAYRELQASFERQEH